MEKRQKQIYDFIKNYMAEKNYPPSTREIGDGVGLKSTCSVHSQLAKMVSNGMLESRGDGSSRTLIVKGARYVFDD